MMRLKFTSLLSIICILMLQSFCHGQTLIYDGYIKGHKVGEMSVEREINDESTKILVRTHVEAHMIVKITVDFTSESTYMNNKLIIGEAESRTNGHSKSLVHTTLKDGFYEVNNDGKVSRISSSDLVGADYYYFALPRNGESVYALATGKMLNVLKENDNTFYFEHDGKKELHTFSDGVLDKLEISHRLYTITFKRRH